MKLYVAEGNSMQTLLINGDIIFVEEKNIDQLYLGDILIYNTPFGLYAHRYFMKYGKHIIAAGDNCRKFECILKDCKNDQKKGFVNRNKKNKERIFLTIINDIYSKYFYFIKMYW